MKEEKKLTVRQSQILRVIVQYYAIHGYGPSIRDLGKATGIKSPNGIMCHVKALIKKGHLYGDADHVARCIQPVKIHDSIKLVAKQLLTEIPKGVSSAHRQQNRSAACM